MMGKKPIILLAAIVPLLGVLAAGQAPLLHISAPQPRTSQTPSGVVGHYWRVVLTNENGQAVSAYAVRFENGGRLLGMRIEDAVPGHNGLHPPLPAGGSATITVPGNSVVTTPPKVTSVAVIYADGTTTGDPAVISNILTVRAVYLGELPATIARLQAIAADPGADPAAVLAHFRNQMQVEQPLVRVGVLRTEPPRVAGSIVANLGRTGPGAQSLQKTAAALVAILQVWEDQLQHSLPKVQPASFPQVP